MASLVPHLVDQGKPSFCRLLLVPNFGTSAAMTAASDFHEIGQRLALVRLAFSDLPQKTWAERHGFAVTQWNNWERGARRIPVEASERLSDLYGLSLDFIYRGKLDGLSESARKVLSSHRPITPTT